MRVPSTYSITEKRYVRFEPEPAAALLRSSLESRPLKIPVKGEGHGDPKLAHQHEAGAIGERPSPIPLVKEEGSGFAELLRIDPHLLNATTLFETPGKGADQLPSDPLAQEGEGLVKNLVGRDEPTRPSPEQLCVLPSGRDVVPVSNIRDGEPSARVHEDHRWDP